MIAGYEHAVQISVLFKAVGVGYLIGLLYSFFSFFNSVNKNTVAVFLRDILFFILNAAISFLFLLKYNAGVVRFYILAGEGIGFLLYHLFPGGIVEAFIRKSLGRIIPEISGKAGAIKKSALCFIKSRYEGLKNKRIFHKISAKKSVTEKKCANDTEIPTARKILRKKDKKNYKNT